MLKSCDTSNFSLFTTVETYFGVPLEVVVKNPITLAWERWWLTVSLG